MYAKSQIQDGGNERDVAIVADSTIRNEYRCQRCEKRFERPKWLTKHEINCNGERKQHDFSGVEGIDWVLCLICERKARTLGKHLTQLHNLTQDAYLKMFPQALITCFSSQEKFNDRSSNWNWIKRANERGEDLSSYKKKMGDAVRKSILANQDERKRRSSLSKSTITKWATSVEGRRVASETAKITSARPEILEARTKRLIYSYKPSKGERALETFVSPLGFRRNVLVKSARFSTKTKRRQIDFLNKEKMIAIEFDGGHHFMNAWKRMSLDTIHKNDLELDDWCKLQGITLIRVSHSQFNTRKNDINEECKKALLSFLETKDREGVFFYGNEYEKYSHPSLTISQAKPLR